MRITLCRGSFQKPSQIGIQPEFAHDVLRNTGIIVADLKAGTGYEVLRWFLELPFADLKQRRIEFPCVGSITSPPGSVQSVLNWATGRNEVSGH